MELQKLRLDIILSIPAPRRDKFNCLVFNMDEP